MNNKSNGNRTAFIFLIQIILLFLSPLIGIFLFETFPELPAAVPILCTLLYVITVIGICAKKILKTAAPGEKSYTVTEADPGRNGRYIVKDNKDSAEYRQMKKNLIPIIICLAVLVLIGQIMEITGNTEFSGTPALIMGTLFMGLFAMIFIFAARATKTQKPEQKKYEYEPAVQAGTNYTATEEAIHCEHSLGKQKYLEQIDNLLANGIIDKAEYRLLKERYEKLDLPDDFH